MPIRKKPGEKKNDFINRCIGVEITSGMKANQAVAVCNSIWEEMSINEMKKKRKYEKLELTKMIKTFNSHAGENYTQFGINELDLLNPKNQAGIVNDDELTLNFRDVIPDGYFVRYKYIPDTEGHNAERPFCKMMTIEMKDIWWSREDIETLNGAPGKANRKGNKPYSVFNWRGGNYCKHMWVRYFYNPDTGDFLRGNVQPLQKSTLPK